MTRPSRANRRDLNEAAIVSFWRCVGCYWIPFVPGQGADGLLFALNGVHLVEIKNPETSWKLTPEELALKSSVERMGHKYNVIQTLDEAQGLVEL